MTGMTLRFVFRVSVVVLLLAILEANPVSHLASNSNATPGSNDRLIVHEWGTFTSIAGKDGVAVEWRPLDDVSDLPGFVYDWNGLGASKGLRHPGRCQKCAMEELVRMETPVIYFYADHQITVSVRVEFLQGKITEWYPRARSVYVPGPRDTIHTSAVDWGRLNVMPGAAEHFPVESEPSHYYPARETDAAPLSVCDKQGDQQEKFLFYRGVGSFGLPLSAKLEGEKVVVKNTSTQRLGPFILFDNRDGRIGYRVVSSFDGEVSLGRPLGDQTVGSLELELQEILVAQGLYEKEARAMIKTWHDSWFEQGLRVFYLVPRKVTDSILQISIEPEPSEMTRVLVGRVELITPEMDREIRDRVGRLADSSVDVRGTAAEIKRKHGRFAEPVLKAVLEETSEPHLRARIQQVINYSSSGRR
jgi:hypothetical protein